MSGGVTTQYLYDGLNVARELSTAGAVLALFTGLLVLKAMVGESLAWGIARDDRLFRFWLCSPDSPGGGLLSRDSESVVDGSLA
jgi:hypothetical protein